MLKFKFLFLALAGTILGDSSQPQTYAVLIAGSNYWYNYRHQADVCHAYQVLHSHGVPDSNIIVMMYDDIANNSANPTPGVILNHPQGDDVYHGVPKDYTGNDVNVENYIAVLTGNADAVKGIGSGRVLKSGPNDRVFLNFVDHGATGILAFPNDVITAQQLITTLQTMNKQNQYGKLVFYVEACEAGSMFQSILPNNINIFVTTASDSTESSYATYYDIRRQTYLGDLYSVNWMEDSDVENLAAETLSTQYGIVKNLTDLSHVMEYGDTTISSNVVGAFQGEQTSLKAIRAHRAFSAKGIQTASKVPRETVPSYDVPLDILFRRLSQTTCESERTEIKQQINSMLTKRQTFENRFRNIVKKVANSEEQVEKWFKSQPKTLTQLDCHHQLIHGFHDNCYNLGQNPYAMKFAYVLANMCEDKINVAQTVAVFKAQCSATVVSQQSDLPGIH